MDITPGESLPFPEGFDPGNGALDLQVIAEAIDANITAKLGQFKTVINKAVRVARSTAAGTAFGPNLRTNILGGLTPFSTVYSSPGSPLGALASLDATGLGSAPGIFRAGAFVVTAPIGATTAGSFRLLEIQALIPNTPTRFPTQFVTKIADSEVYETNTGAEWQMAELEIMTPFPDAPNGQLGFVGTQFTAYMTHRNFASNLQVLAGSVVWLYRAADVEV